MPTVNQSTEKFISDQCLDGYEDIMEIRRFMERCRGLGIKGLDTAMESVNRVEGNLIAIRLTATPAPITQADKELIQNLV